ncbi:nickel/cobalt transporter [Aestuariispira ectoiniformans]|uniref:nickel/cobalt transporter n=1 Tax=Aestuariispira ectoiniformans TaxID=2775080 RepID=UPI00223C14F5|nr:nickel/cobalt transporter [Aestuariispira ectoiniformans]
MQLKSWFPALALVCGLVAGGLIFADMSHAASPLAPASGETTTAASDPGFLDQAIFFVQQKQNAFHRELTRAIQGLKSAESRTTAGWTLISLGFLYGIFHAAGPGHGKAVISAYLLANENMVRRGILISFAASFAQGLCAIILVLATVGLLDLQMRKSMEAARWFEVGSYALITGLGLLLFIRAISGLVRKKPPVHSCGHSHGGHSHGGVACNHNHGPSTDQLRDPLSWKSTAALVLSIGMRPCSGSILVLLFAASIGFYGYGTLTVLAVSLGTAITVSALAVLTLLSRKTALHVLKLEGDKAARMELMVKALAGVVIVLFGLILLSSLAAGPHPLFR